MLLSYLGKLCEKVLAAILHYEGQKWGALQVQFGSTKQQSTVDAGMMRVHCTRKRWARGLDTSVLAFDVACHSVLPVHRPPHATGNPAQTGLQPQAQSTILTDDLQSTSETVSRPRYSGQLRWGWYRDHPYCGRYQSCM